MIRYNFIKTSFNAGEFSPSIYGRVDLEKYNNGCIEMKNFIPIPQGGATRRPGFEYIADAKNDGEKVRLIPFQFSDEQSYIVECGTDYLRYFKDGGQILTVDSDTTFLLHMDGADASTTFENKGAGRIEAATIAFVDSNPDTITDSGSGFVTANMVVGSITVSGSTSNDGTYAVDTVAAGTLTLAVGETLTAEAAGDTVTITMHPVTAHGNAQVDTAFKKFGSGAALFDGTGDYLSIPDSAAWHMGTGNFTIDFWFKPSDVSGNVELFQQYTDSDNFITLYWDGGAPNENKFHFEIRTGGSYTVDEYSNEYTLQADTWYHFALIRGWGGNANVWAFCLDGVEIGTFTDADAWHDEAAAFEIGRVATNCFEGHIDEPRISKGVARWTENFTPPTRSYPLDTTDGTICEDTSTGILESELDTLKYAQSYDTMYIVHKDQVPMKLTRADHDDWLLANVSFTGTPTDWGSGNGYPRAVTFHQDRLVLAGSPGFPPRFWFSKTSDYEVMTTGTGDDDGFTITLLSGSVDMIYWLESQRRLVAGSNSGEWWLSGDGNDLIITPTSKQAQNDTKHGSVDVQPINIGNTLLLPQAPGTKIRELSYNYDTDSYVSNDITILADHMLKGHSVKQMAYQQAPYQIVWVLRSDGTLFALTYMKEHEVVGWSEVETDGTVISIATIPGEPEDELWIAVEREINSTTKTYIERLKNFEFDSLQDAFMVDSGLTYDGAATTSISGLDHLEGETVDVLADGVVGSYTVSSGAITLSTAASMVHIGMPYDSNLQTMYVDIPMETGSSMFIKKRVPTVNFRVRDSAGGKYGKDSSNLVDLLAETPLYSGDITNKSVTMGWTRQASIYIKQDDPLPLTIDTMVMEVEVGR